MRLTHAHNVWVGAPPFFSLSMSVYEGGLYAQDIFVSGYPETNEFVFADDFAILEFSKPSFSSYSDAFNFGLSFTFANPDFTGTKKIYLRAVDENEDGTVMNDTGWVPIGEWRIREP